ncbi:MAG: hybrid sensor histidine kinase/response regulator, partial [Alphaproteobacteria bacterium]|nr:hybrid sensor histidine kinase/response regulator [Alphaproteobacteria bacterium]
LVVDDHESARSLLKRRLAIYGYEVLPAEDYKKAVKTLSSQNVDVIFLNMFINGQSSYDFLRKLKENEKCKSIPVIMMSSDSDMELIVRCIEAGAEDYMVKPLNQTLLKARLSNCIARKEAYDKEIAYLAKIEQGQKQIVAQEKMASIGVLVSSISQELKNPLNFIINFAGVSAEICAELRKNIEDRKTKIETDIFEYLDAHLKKFQANVKKVSEYGQNADKILRFMLSQSNEDSGQKHPGNINKIVTQTISMLLSSYKSAGKSNLPRIDTSLDNAVPHIMLSTQSISKAIYNILDNAVYSVMTKYEEDISKAEIKITTEHNHDSITIIIHDNGTGIKEDVKDKIFNPFFTTKPEGAGVGLGLSSTKEIVEDHKGSISMESTEGEFAEFTVTIPKMR